MSPELGTDSLLIRYLLVSPHLLVDPTPDVRIGTVGRKRGSRSGLPSSVTSLS